MKRAIAIALVLTMVLPLLAACQTATPTAAPTTAAATAAPGSATAAPTQEPTQAPTEAPPEGNKNLCPYSGDPVTFNIFAADVGVKEDVNGPVYQIYKKAVGNVELKWETVPFSDFDTKAKLYFNSGDIPDLIWYRSPDLMKDYSNSGLFLDLNQYKDIMPNWNAAVLKNPALLTNAAADGKQYIMQGVDNDYPGESWFANMTVLKKCGITSVPTTLDELAADMQKIREADASVIPFHTFWGISYYKAVFGTALNAQGGGIYFNLADKKWKFSLTTPESRYKELVALLADYYKKGYFNAEFSTMSDDQTQQTIVTNNWAFTFTYMGQIYAWYKADSRSALPIEIEPFLPVSASGVKPNIWCAYVSDAPYWGYSASAKIKNPELACSWMDTMLGDAVADAFQWGVEGTSYTRDASGKKSWIPEFLAKGDQAQKDLGIWNIMGPRYITKRDDSSLMQKWSTMDQKAEKLLVDAIKGGKIDSYYYRSNPQFTDSETEELSAIMTPVNTKLTEGEAQFILGKRPLTEWDAFVEEVKAVGNIDRAVEIYNGAKQSPDRLQGIDRNYITP